MPRTIFAFNGDLESRLALHWLVHERGYEVVALAINLGQEVYLEPLGELALELGARSAEVIDRRTEFLRDFAFPVLQANAVYQTSCFLGSALGRYVIARELVEVAHREGCRSVSHGAAGKGNDQVRMEVAIAAQDPSIEVLAPVRHWNLRSLQDKLSYARRRRVPVEEPGPQAVAIDRTLWGASISVPDLVDPWAEPPAAAFTLTRDPADAPAEAASIALGFAEGSPCSLDGQPLSPLALVRELNRLGGEHGVGRSDAIEDRLFGIKSREFYEAPAPTILLAAHRELQNLVQSRELVQMREVLSRRYAELVYAGLWFNDARTALQAFFDHVQHYVTGEVRLQLSRGSCRVTGRRSPYSLYDGQLANQANLEWFASRWGEWAQAFTSLWSLPSRLAARRPEPGEREGCPQPGAGGAAAGG